MKYNHKMALVAAVGVFVSTLAASFLLTSGIFKQYKNEKLNAMEQIRETFGQIVNSKIQSFADQLAQQIQQTLNGSDNTTETFNKRNFFAAYGLVSYNQGSDGVPWHWESFRAQQPDLTQGWFESIMQTAPVETVRGSQVVWLRAEAPDKQVYFLLLSAVELKEDSRSEQKIMVGALPISAFSDLAKQTKSYSDRLFLVNSYGFAFVYPEVTYVGAQLDSDPIVQSLLKNQSNESNVDVRDSAGSFHLGGYSRINQSNLYVVMSAPFYSKISLALKLYAQIAIVCFSLMLFAYVIVTWLGARQSEKLNLLEKNLELANKKSSSELNVTRSEVRSDQEITFAHGLTQFLRAPFQALMGYAQVLTTGISGKAESLDRFNNELRKIRDFMESLEQRFTKGSHQPELLSIPIILGQVLMINQNALAEKGIVVEKAFTSEPQVRANYEDFKTALKVLVGFCIDKIDPSNSKKKMIFRLGSRPGFTEIQIEVVGGAVTEEQRRQMFQPFKVQYPASQIFDLDLALAHSLIGAQNGDLHVEKLGAHGFRFAITLPALMDSVHSTLSTTKKVEESPMLAEKKLDETSIYRPNQIGAPPPAPDEKSNSEIELVETVVLSHKKDTPISIRKPKLRDS